jgi:hypothetical protein
MNRIRAFLVGLLLAAALLSGGCGTAPAPFKFHSDEDLAHYNKVATDIEYPNIVDCPSDAAITCPSPEMIGPDSQPAYWDLKLEEAMQMGLAKSKVMHDLGGTVLRSPPNIRTIADPAIIDTDPRYGVEAALSEFDAVFHSRFDYQRNNRFVNNVFFGGGTRELRQDTDVFRSEITKTAATGSTFNFAHNTVYDHNNSPGNLFGSSWDTNFEASWRQPLLQGAGVEYNRIAGPKGSPGNLNGVLIARINTDISLSDFEIGLRDLVSNIENAYWDLYFAYRDLDAKITARDNALDSWRKTHALFLAGRRGGEAEKEAEAREQYFTFQEEVQNAWSGRLYEPTQTNNGSGGGTFRATGGVRVSERRLRFLLGLPTNDGRLIRPGDEPSLAKVVYNWDEVLPEAVSRRPELRRQRWTIKRDELALIASRNFLLPKFDSFALYRIRGFGHDLKDGTDNTPENSAFDDLTHGQHEEWEAGLELTVPLGERQGHAAVRNSQLLLSRDRAILDDQERQVVLDVSNAVAEVDRSYQVAQTAFNRRMAAKADVASTKAAYEADKAPLDLYLEAQRRIATAESQFFAALVEYALAIKNLQYAKGSLLDYNEIYLSEGPWPAKAYHDAENRRSSRWQPKALNYIFHQPPPVSIGTEPNYQLPPPVGPMGPPPGPMPGSRLEELPKAAPSGPPQMQPPVPPQDKPSAPSQNSGPSFSDKRPSSPPSVVRAAIPQPIVQPAPAPRWSPLPEQQQPPAEPQRPAMQAIRDLEREFPPRASQPPQSAPRATESAKIPPQPTAPVVQPARTAWQPPAGPAADFNQTFSAMPTAAESANVSSPVSMPRFGNLLRDPQSAVNPAPGNFNSLRPQNKPASAERWPIPAVETTAVQAPMPGPVISNRDALTRAAETDQPRESIFVSSARGQRASVASGNRPLPQTGPTNPYGAPISPPINDLRSSVYPAESKPIAHPWPVSNESANGSGVQPTSFTNALRDPQAAAPNRSRPPILQPFPPLPSSDSPLPSPSTRPLPPIVLPTQPLPPVQ